MSEPITNNSRNVNPGLTVPRRPRSATPTKSSEAGPEEKEKADKDLSSPQKPHPNETVVLDVLKTNEKIENCDELVIPDEMVMYLNQVGDDTTTLPDGPSIKLDANAEGLVTTISIEKIKEEDLFSLLAEVEVKTENTAGTGGLCSEVNNSSDGRVEREDSKSQILCKS